MRAKDHILRVLNEGSVKDVMELHRIGKKSSTKSFIHNLLYPTQARSALSSSWHTEALVVLSS